LIRRVAFKTFLSCNSLIIFVKSSSSPDCIHSSNIVSISDIYFLISSKFTGLTSVSFLTSSLTTVGSIIVSFFVSPLTTIAPSFLTAIH
jgi:hypothetical protein